MRLRFRRRIPLFGHVYANLGRGGVTLSWRPTRWFSVSRRGVTASVPHTGISVNEPWRCLTCGRTT